MLQELITTVTVKKPKPATSWGSLLALTFILPVICFFSLSSFFFFFDEKNKFSTFFEPKYSPATVHTHR